MKVATVAFKRQEFATLTTVHSLVARIEEVLVYCAEKRIELVVFPALIGNLFTLGKGYEEKIRELSKHSKQIYICPGSYWQEAGGKLYHVSSLIKNGEVLLKQKQIYLAKWEKSKGLSRGNDISYFSVGDFKIGIILATDVFYPQVSRAFTLEGINLLLAPTTIKVNPSLPNKGQSVSQLSGVWQNVQQNLFFAVESGFNGSFEGMDFYAKSYIHAPLEMTDKFTGFLASETDEFLLTATLDFEQRKEAISRFNPLKQLNPVFYQQLFERSGL